MQAVESTDCGAAERLPEGDFQLRTLVGEVVGCGGKSWGAVSPLFLSLPAVKRCSPAWREVLPTPLGGHRSSIACHQQVTHRVASGGLSPPRPPWLPTAPPHLPKAPPTAPHSFSRLPHGSPRHPHGSPWLPTAPSLPPVGPSRGSLLGGGEPTFCLLP